MGIPVFDLSRVLEWVANRALDVAKWLLIRALILAVAFTVVPVALYYSWIYIGEKLLTFIGDQMGASGVFTGQMVQLSGLSGWLASHLQLAQCFTVLASAASFLFVMRIIKR